MAQTASPRRHTAAAEPQRQYATTGVYIIGFVLSLTLTIEAYLLAVHHTFSGHILILVLLGLAIVQLLVQFIFFLHLDKAARAPWNIIILLFTGLVITIVVYGSLWIMQNLDYHMRSPAETEQYLHKNDEGF